MGKNVIQHFAKEGYDPIFGARPLKRLIQHKIVNLLSNGILEGKIENNSVLHLFSKQDKGKFIIEYNAMKK